MPAALPEARLARAFSLADGAEYRAWTVASLFGDDVLEFVLRATSDGGGGGGSSPASSSSAAAAAGAEEATEAAGVTARAGRGGGGASNNVLVTYRSQAGKLRFLYPLQTPISDGGAQKRRLDALRGELGWPIEGCSYIECYS